MRITHLFCILGAVLAGCGGMMTGPDTLRGAVDEAVDEDQTHLAATRVVATMPAMFDEVDRHISRMDAIMDGMRTHMESMSHCSSIQSMMDLRTGMRAELDAHAAVMHAMANLGDARIEAEHHFGTMAAMLGDMGMMLDGMHCGGW